MLTTLTVGTRTSKLALWQTDYVIERLQEAWPDLICQKKPFVTKGDKTLDKPLPEIGGKGLFTAELEQALRNGTIDIAVHSLKDLPVADAEGLMVGAIPTRAPVQDGLVARNGWTLQTLPEGARVGTSSLRRQAQLWAIRPDLDIQPIRGNVDTRIRKVLRGDYDAAVLAGAGLTRLGLEEHVTEWLSLEEMLPAPGQGALAVQCRAGDTAVLELLAALEDAATRRAVSAERHFLQALGGGCSAPIAAYARTTDAAALHLIGLVASPDGEQVVRASDEGEAPEAVAERLAAVVLEDGGRAILAHLTQEELGSGPPLAGKRIAITRAHHQAPEMAALLLDLGATPVVIPAIEIVPMPDTGEIDEAIAELAHYDWVIFTSVNGVAIFWQRLAAAGLDASAFSRIEVAAIGPATAQALADLGVVVTYVPDEFVAESLADGLGDMRGKRVLLPRAELARQTLVTMLQDQGAEVNNVPTYRTLPARPNPEAVAELRKGVDVLSFTSSSTVRNFVNMLEQQLPPGEVRTLLAQSLIACIGPITAGTAEELGLQPDIVADEYTIEGLIRAIVTYYTSFLTVTKPE